MPTHRLKLVKALPSEHPEPHFRQSRMLLPEYSEKFQCIGPACEDSCCQGWTVPIDRAAYEKYQTVPTGPLRTLIDTKILLTPTDPNPAHYARVEMPESQICPFLNQERLCQIQCEHGAEFLSVTCATYPRVAQTIDNLKGVALSLSCPEAARLVLLKPRLLAPSRIGGYQIAWEDSGPGEPTLLPYFWPIREFILGLIQNRAYPLWQRLFLVGAFCRRLDALKDAARQAEAYSATAQRSVEPRRGFPSLYHDFAGAVTAGGLRAAMDAIPADLGLQLDMVLRLTALGSNRARTNPRFLDCLRAFAAGIGLGPNVALEDQIAGYSAAYARAYAPFVARNPHILENYLINQIFAKAFPFGVQNGKLPDLPDAAKEFAQLATQFGLMKGLLIGVAGFHGNSFSADHVVHTVQAASKHFEHHPEFLAQALALLKGRGLDNAHGLTMLLRN